MRNLAIKTMLEEKTMSYSKNEKFYKEDQQPGEIIYLKKNKGRKTKHITCYVCEKEFQPKNSYERFCLECKEDSELLRFC